MKVLIQENWFTVLKISETLFVIRERLDKLDPRFHTRWTNLFVILGKSSALLFDTGSGLNPIKGIVKKIIQNRKLIVVNSHHHFDHVCGNSEFPHVYIHTQDKKSIENPIDLSFLQTSTSTEHLVFAPSYKLLLDCEILTIEDGHVFDLGDCDVTVHHLPGHTPGSIALSTSNNEVLTGDIIGFGAIYLPVKRSFPQYLKSLEKLNNFVKEKNTQLLFSGHEEVQINSSAIDLLIEVLTSNHLLTSSKQFDTFLDAYLVDKSPFRVIIPKDYFD